MVEKNNVTDTTGNLGTPDVILSHTYAVIIGLFSHTYAVIIGLFSHTYALTMYRMCAIHS